MMIFFKHLFKYWTPPAITEGSSNKRAKISFRQIVSVFKKWWWKNQPVGQGIAKKKKKKIMPFIVLPSGINLFLSFKDFHN